MTRKHAAEHELAQYGGCVKDGNWNVSEDCWSVPVLMEEEEGELFVWFAPHSTTIEDSYITDWT